MQTLDKHVGAHIHMLVRPTAQISGLEWGSIIICFCRCAGDLNLPGTVFNSLSAAQSESPIFTLGSNHHHVSFVCWTDSRRYRCRRRSRKGVSTSQSGVFGRVTKRYDYSYSLLYASRGANVVVNDFNKDAAQKVVDEITQGMFVRG